MAIECTTPTDKVDEAIRVQLERVNRATVATLTYIGEQCVKRARQYGYGKDYTDRTGNLRSSVGFVIVNNGAIVKMSDFEPVMSGAEGGNDGRQYAAELAANYTTGWALIVVAGMEYASFVADRGYDVLAGAQLLADTVVPQKLEEMRQQIERSLGHV